MGLLRRRTVRMRLTTVYGALFVVISLGLLGILNGVVASHSTYSTSTAVAPGQGSTAGAGSALAAAQDRIQRLQDQLTAATNLQSSETRLLVIGSLVALVVMTVVSLALGWSVAGRVLRPLRAMTAATRRISADSLHERLGLDGPQDELRDLSDTIDGLLERLEGSFAAQRRFVANAAHELRTPLATMRASLDVALAKPSPVPATAVAERLYAELDHVDRLLDGLLLLARAQHGDLPGTVTLSLDAAAAASVAARSSAIASRGLTVSTSGCPDGAWVTGNPELVSRMVDNLVDNAIVHNQPGGWIRLSVLSDGPVASVIVENGGSVMAPDAVAELAQPFRRFGADRVGSDKGAGLGLSIVAAIASAHRGALDLRARPDGGMCVCVEMPSA